MEIISLLNNHYLPSRSYDIFYTDIYVLSDMSYTSVILFVHINVLCNFVLTLSLLYYSHIYLRTQLANKLSRT